MMTFATIISDLDTLIASLNAKSYEDTFESINNDLDDLLAGLKAKCADEPADEPVIEFKFRPEPEAPRECVPEPEAPQKWSDLPADILAHILPFLTTDLKRDERQTRYNICKKRADYGGTLLSQQDWVEKRTASCVFLKKSTECSKLRYNITNPREKNELEKFLINANHFKWTSRCRAMSDRDMASANKPVHLGLAGHLLYSKCDVGKYFEVLSFEYGKCPDGVYKSQGCLNLVKGKYYVF